ncbi:hypothetical protein ACFOPQ_19810 [Deinococcus antarcticus]|uniref:Uncharacterized protein n=1 Tax=Deinococcus antarcticus TaxID=1298767 RepID=A0ABV8ABG4_9DEIO
MNKQTAKARLAEIGPHALKHVLEVRETIALCQRIGARENAVLIPELRRSTLQYIAQVKKEYRQLKAALEGGVYD